MSPMILMVNGAGKAAQGTPLILVREGSVPLGLVQ